MQYMIWVQLRRDTPRGRQGEWVPAKAKPLGREWSDPMGPWSVRHPDAGDPLAVSTDRDLLAAVAGEWASFKSLRSEIRSSSTDLPDATAELTAELASYVAAREELVAGPACYIPVQVVSPEEFAVIAPRCAD